MKRIIQIPYYLSILVFCFVASSVEATVYKWTDKDGNVQFSQSPRDADSVDQKYDLQFRADKPLPADSKKEANDGTSSEKSASKKPLSDQEKAAIENQQQAASAKKAGSDDHKKVNCNNSQKHLGKISQGGRFYEVDKSGERSYWDDDMLKRKVSEAQSLVQKWCDG